jgi:dimethylamine monooxygenase subunit A
MAQSESGKPMLGKHMGFPFADGNYSFGLGLAPLREETWLDIDDEYVAEMREKARRLRDEHDAVFIAVPGSERGQSEVLGLLLRHLEVYYPNLFRFSASIAIDRLDPLLRIENRISGESRRLGDFLEMPLDLAGRLVQEDLCLMSPGPDETYVLSAGSLCFPFRWELRDKMGLPLTEIHHPVPGYREKLAGPADRYMLQLKPERPSWRCNWNVVDAPDLHLKIGPPPTGITADNAGSRLWIRCERQTLRKLPNSGDVLFTIRTYIRPLSILESIPSLATNLMRALDQIPSEMRVYKSQPPFRAALMSYLKRITAAA